MSPVGRRSDFSHTPWRRGPEPDEGVEAELWSIVSNRLSLTPERSRPLESSRTGTWLVESTQAPDPDLPFSLVSQKSSVNIPARQLCSAEPVSFSALSPFALRSPVSSTASLTCRIRKHLGTIHQSSRANVGEKTEPSRSCYGNRGLGGGVHLSVRTSPTESTGLSAVTLCHRCFRAVHRRVNLHMEEESVPPSCQRSNPARGHVLSLVPAAAKRKCVTGFNNTLINTRARADQAPPGSSTLIGSTVPGKEDAHLRTAIVSLPPGRGRVFLQNRVRGNGISYAGLCHLDILVVVSSWVQGAVRGSAPIERETGRETDRETGRETDRQTDREVAIWIDRPQALRGAGVASQRASVTADDGLMKRAQSRAPAWTLLHTQQKAPQ
ncbi:unnamed protein product [Pleuronectes platessa]|uniref:Uncharacterized protein n=1 Tax=Pleuronectes platessa TaxID=8262 RepID=A0A9N7W3X0_PLEPL|nr:unnamed protein product [Pleuronectes platessa]